MKSGQTSQPRCARLRTGVEQASTPTAVECGSADREPSGKFTEQPKLPQRAPRRGHTHTRVCRDDGAWVCDVLGSRPPACRCCGPPPRGVRHTRTAVRLPGGGCGAIPPTRQCRPHAPWSPRVGQEWQTGKESQDSPVMGLGVLGGGDAPSTRSMPAGFGAVEPPRSSIVSS